jgi:hypothetical protein
MVQQERTWSQKETVPKAKLSRLALSETANFFKKHDTDVDVEIVHAIAALRIRETHVNVVKLLPILTLLPFPKLT